MTSADQLLPRLAVPDSSFHSSRDLRSQLLRRIATGHGISRADLARETGLARSTISDYLQPLIERGLLRENSSAKIPMGRPPVHLHLRAGAGMVLAADLGASHARLRLADLAQQVLAETVFSIQMSAGPERVLAQILDAYRHLRDRLATPAPPLCGTVVGLPGPVDFERKVPVRPPLMPAWDEFPVGSFLAGQLGCPVLVDNDVNLMALGEARLRPPGQSPLLFIKVSTGIGCGMIGREGNLHRGADGSAGDIGHVRLPQGDQVVCRCGNVGCIEALAAAPALIQSLQQAGIEVDDLDGLLKLISNGHSLAIRATRQAAQDIGEVVAMLVHVYNPAAIVLGGSLALVSDDLLAGVRSVVYSRSLPLATRRLAVEKSLLSNQAGVVGGMVLAIETALSSDGLERLLAASPT